MPRGFRSCAPFRKPLGRHRRRLRQITAPLIPAFQSLTFAAARENPWNRGSVAKVGLAVQRQFEVGRGALVYGFLFYPLLTLGTDQLFRVLEAGVNAKCEALHAPANRRSFLQKLTWLVETGNIPESERKRWDTARLLRNHSTHARDQNIYDPTLALDALRLTVELINALFLSG